jgi:uncharacterized protein (TIGR02271 family)
MGLRRLSEATGYAVTSSSTDVRGWTALTGDGAAVGQVVDLLFEPGEQEVRLAELELDGRHRVIWPVSRLTLDEARRTVVLEGLGRDGLAALEPYEQAPPRIQLIEEHLELGKRSVQAGEVVLERRADFETIEQDLTLWGDDLEVERHPVDRPATAADQVQVDGDTVRVPIIRERLVVEKRAFVVEEVVITRRRGERTEHLREQVRKDRLFIDGKPLDEAP